MSYRYVGGEAPILGELDEAPPDERTAWHESGHAVIGHALGATIVAISLRDPAHVVFAADADLTPVQSIARNHAGAVGEMSWLRFWSSGRPDDDDDYLHRVAAFQFGGCDGCHAAVAAWTAVGFPAGIDAARAVLREGQRLALDIGQQRPVWLAIRTLANELMRDSTLTGERAHAIIEPYVKFGSMNNVENHP